MTFKSLHSRTADGIITIDNLTSLNNLAAPQLGDIRFVIAEDKNYSYTSGGWVEVAGGGGGGGGVNGPVSSTNNAVALWSGTGGVLLKNSVTVVDPITGVTTGISINADGAGNAITNIENADIKAGAAIDATKIADGTVSNTEFQYLDGVTSAIQTQLNTDATNLSNHISNPTGAHAASAIANTPSGNISSTTVQAALNELQTDVDSRQLTSQKGAANGYASLDGGGKVPVAQLPATLMTYEGTWNATTNTPTLANGTGDAGMVYIVNVAGTVNFGAGPITFAVGDWVIYNGTIWQKSDNADDVVSVNGLTGVVTLNAAAVDAIAEMGTVVNHRLVKTQGTTGGTVEQTGITVTNSNHMSGVAQLDVDNVRVDDNTVSAISGDLTLNAGANVVNVEAANVFLRAGADLSFYDNDNTNAITVSVPNNVTTNRTPQIPDDTGNFVLDSATQTLTAKDIDGGTASNTSRLTVPKASKATLDALTRKEATVVYASDEDRLYVDNGTSLVPVGSSNATGTGETNYITNPSAVAAITGWTNVGDLDVFRTTTASELPREYTTAAGIKIISDPNAQSTADYVYFDFTLDDVDLNKKLKIQWSQKQFGAYVAGQLAVVITTQADRTTAIATPDVTAIPAYDGVFTASFDTASTATLSLVIRATTDMATDIGIVISDVIVGPGQIVAAAPIGPWQSYTPVVTNWASSTPLGKWRRVGDTMECQIQVSYLAGVPSGTIEVSIPSGYTVDTSALTNANSRIVGRAICTETSAGLTDVGTVQVLTNTVRFLGDDAAGVWNATVPRTWSSTINQLQATFSLPIAEWAGSPNYAGTNDVEYAYNSSTSTSTDSSSFAYGNTGIAIAAFAPSGTTAVTKRVRFQTPVQDGDLVSLEFYYEGKWQDVSSTPFKFDTNDAGTTFYGCYWVSFSSNTTDIEVRFQSAALVGTAWSAISTYKWRAKKIRAGVAVGFGAATSTSSGLLQPPTNIEDVKATQMGLKSYAHGTTYNGGIAPTVTLTGGGGSLSSVDSSSFIPYQMQDGNWRLKGSITVNLDSQTRTTAQLSVNGVTFNGGQAISATPTATGAYVSRMRANNASSAMDVLHASATTTTYYFSFDVALSSKPTWAY